MSARESRRVEETFWGEAKLTIGNERPNISDHSHLQPFLLFHIVLENGHRRQLLPNLKQLSLNDIGGCYRQKARRLGLLLS